MAHTFVQATLPYETGLPEDIAQNGFHFESAAALTEAQRNALGALIIAFYNTDAGPVPLNIAELMSRGVSRIAGACTLDFYEGPPPYGPPVQSNGWTLGAISADSGAGEYPDEVAITLSLSAITTETEGDSDGPRPAARARGRLYLGPWNTAVGIVVASHLRPSSNARATIADAAHDLAVASAASSGGPVWSIYSRTDADLKPILRGWVDDAFDTQRRRGVHPTTRTTFTV